MPLQDDGRPIFIVPSRVADLHSDIPDISRGRVPTSTKHKMKKGKAKEPQRALSAAEQAILNNQKAMSEMREINYKLASEMHHARENTEAEMQKLRTALSHTETEVRSHQERADEVSQRLSQETIAHEHNVNRLSVRLERRNRELLAEQRAREKAEAQSVSLTKQVQGLTTRIEELEGLQTDESKRRADATALAQKNEFAVAAEKRINQDLHDRVQDLEKKLGAREISFADLSHKHTNMEGVVRSLSERNSLLMDAHAVLENEVAKEREARAREAEQAQSGAAALRAEIAALQEQLAKERTLLANAEHDKQTLQAKLDNAEEKLQREVARGTELATALAAAEKARHEASHALSTCESQRSQLEAEHKQASASLETEKFKSMEASQAMGVSRVELEIAKQEVGMLTSRVTAKEEMLAEANQTVNSQERALAELRAEVSMVQERHSSLEKELHREQTRATSFVERSAEAEAKCTSMLQTLHDRDITVQDQAKDLAAKVREVEVLQAEGRAAREAAAREVESWRERHSAVAAERGEAHLRLEEMRTQHNLAIEQLERQLDQAKESKWELSEALRDTREESLASAAAHSEKLSVVTVESEDWQRRYASTEHELKQREGELREAEDKLSAADRRALDLEMRLREVEAATTAEVQSMKDQQAYNLERAIKVEVESANRRAAEAEAAVGRELEHVGKLREDHAVELTRKQQVLTNVIAAMETEERAKLAAIQEAEDAKAREADASALVERLKAALAEALSNQQRAVEEQSRTREQNYTLNAKNDMYRKENQTLLQNYDRWLKHVIDDSIMARGKVEPRGSSGGAGMQSGLTLQERAALADRASSLASGSLEREASRGLAEARAADLSSRVDQARTDRYVERARNKVRLNRADIMADDSDSDSPVVRRKFDTQLRGRDLSSSLGNHE